ncbi:MAG: YicC/YloC family endoribonuclease [Stellaceae bacterium]
MTVASMTGFARAEGHELGIGWVWELKSVNAKALDLRFRLPAGYEGLEVQLRAGLAETLKRGAVSASLVLTRHDNASPLRVNRAALDALMALVKQLSSEIDVAPPRLDGLLAVKGVLESGDVEDDATRERRQAALLKGFAAALKDLAAMRLAEGKRLAQTLEARLAEITDLVVKAEKSAAAQPAAVKARLKKLLAQLLEAVPALPEERLAQEAALIVARDDVREELDRLTAHVAATRALIKEGGAIGRRLDFLCQELNREANTLGAKSGDLELTRIGLALKAAIEQLREQVQNVE